MAKFGWGDAVGKIASWIPGREEARRNRIDQIRKEMDEIAKKSPTTTRDADRYSKLSNELSVLEKKASNG